MYLQFHSVKEPSKNHDIWFGFCLVLYGARFGSVWGFSLSKLNHEQLRNKTEQKHKITSVKIVITLLLPPMVCFSRRLSIRLSLNNLT